MLAREWKNWNFRVLVRMKNAAAARENSMMVLQKSKNRIPRSQIPHFWVYIQKN